MAGESDSQQEQPRVLGKAVFPDGKESFLFDPLAPPSAEVTWQTLKDLNFAVACYLASDGSFGLYDAETAITSREAILKIVSLEGITAIQDAIRQSKKPGEIPG